MKSIVLTIDCQRESKSTFRYSARCEKMNSGYLVIAYIYMPTHCNNISFSNILHPLKFFATLAVAMAPLITSQPSKLLQLDFFALQDTIIQLGIQFYVVKETIVIFLSIDALV